MVWRERNIVYFKSAFWGAVMSAAVLLEGWLISSFIEWKLLVPDVEPDEWGLAVRVVILIWAFCSVFVYGCLRIKAVRT